MIGQTVSHYKILEEIGHGALGLVYKAQDLKFDRSVVFRRLPPDLLTDEEAKRRAVYEAKAVSALDHPNICKFHEIEELPDGQTVITSEYYEGEKLKDRLEQGEMDLEEAFGVVAQLALGLAVAHEKGIAHGDVKPANVLMTSDGQVKILDFGVAKLAAVSSQTRTGSAVSDVAYMSPEQITGEAVDARSDIFSLGVVLYEMLSGARPFGGDHEDAVIFNIMNEDPEPLANRRSDLPTHLQEWVGRALQKSKKNRPSSLEGFVAELTAGETVATGPAVRVEPRAAARLKGAGPGDAIGPYRLAERIGVGGMGEVWAADQTEPIQRRVALKIIKLGMDTAEVVVRFEAERQALALMDHPCIARVYDAGSTPQGRPFFAMEFVHGVPINEYCDRHRLTNRERAELFIRLCEGVQHAHQKAVIHRDLKPTNVLVTEVDGKPVPKIIDFGVAKAMSQELTDKTMHTHIGQMIGTPEYMSPEQADLTAEDIDTRTDVYSLGTILYELMVGALPFDSKELRGSGFEGIRRKIREEEPSKPSQRVTTLGEISASAATSRRTDAAALSGQLKGDLDWIIMKALEKDRARRYASASDLAADVQRHLRNEPVLAGPPSTVYRLKKFVVRHKYAVAAAGLVAGALVLGIAGTTVSMIRAINAEQLARDEAAAASQVAGFLEDLFAVSDPGEAKGNTVTAREILDDGAGRIATELQGQPLVQARLMVTMGRVYRLLGLYGESRPLLEEALDLRRSALGDRTLEVAAAEEELGRLLSAEGDYEGAQPLYESALAIREDLLGRDDPEVARTVSNLANLYRQTRDFERAGSLYRRAIAIREKVLGPDHPDVSNSLNGLAIVHESMGDYEGALPLYMRALEIREKALGPEHPQVATSLNNLATLYWFMGDVAAARPYNERALLIQERVLGPDHPDLAHTLNTAANLRTAVGEYAESRRLHERALAIREKNLRPDHPRIAESYYNLGCVSALQGDRQAAIGFLRESIDRGFANPIIFEDPDLASLRGQADFEGLLAGMRDRLGKDE